MEPNSPQDKAKRAAGVQAIATYLKNGMLDPDTIEVD
jgi:hypothetical protein